MSDMLIVLMSAIKGILAQGRSKSTFSAGWQSADFQEQNPLICTAFYEGHPNLKRF